MAKNLVVHWGDLAARMPVGSDRESVMRRRELFESWNTKGEGILMKAALVRYLFRLLPTVGGIADMMPVLERGFKSVASNCPPVTTISMSFMDRNQVRVLFVYIWNYFKIWELLSQHPLEVKGYVSLSEFEAALHWLREWGFTESREWTPEPEQSWEALTGGTNIMKIEDFCDRVVRGSLQSLSKAGDAEERFETARLLQRQFPHMQCFDSVESPKAGGRLAGGMLGGIKSSASAPSLERLPVGGNSSFIRKVPPNPHDFSVPPPGQRRPHAAFVRRNPPEKSWLTSYMSDYEQPNVKTQQGTSAMNSAAPSRLHTVPQSQDQSRPYTPPGATGRKGPARDGPPLSLAHGSRLPGMHKSSSVPEVGMGGMKYLHGAQDSMRELDRDALRQKLENHLEMSTTFHMRKLLRVAREDGSQRRPTSQMMPMG
jgi:hypothetical protein